MSADLGQGIAQGEAMAMSVHLLETLEANDLAYLRERLDPAIELTCGLELPSPAQYQVLVAGRPQRDHLTASPNLRALIIPWSGVPRVTCDLVSEFPHVAVHNLHYNATAVAEMAVALLLAAAKFIVPIDRAFRSHNWTSRYRPDPAVMLEGKTALILGYGAIGQHVARVVRGLGMKVMAVRRRLPAAPPDVPDEIHPTQALHHLLPRADAVLICLPHTPATDRLIGT